jgi:hypothetical protein
MMVVFFTIFAFKVISYRLVKYSIYEMSEL